MIHYTYNYPHSSVIKQKISADSHHSLHSLLFFYESLNSSLSLFHGITQGTH